MMWNYVGTKRDLFEKTTVVSLIVCIVGIGAGAETAFRGTTKPTALAAFLANVVLAIRALLRTRGSPLAEQSEAQEDTETFGLRAPGRLSGLVDATALALSAVPYLVAFAIGDGEGAGDQDRQDTLVVLFWVALGLGLLRTLALQQLLAVLTSNTSLVLPTANVHALAERYGLITIIVFGETFLSTLIEGAAVFSNASATRIIVGTGIAAAITYSLHSLYFDVDNRLLRSDKQYVDWHTPLARALLSDGKPASFGKPSCCTSGSVSNAPFAALRTDHTVDPAMLLFFSSFAGSHTDGRQTSTHFFFLSDTRC